MTLSDWQNNGWLKQHLSSPEEIRDLFAKVDRDIIEAVKEVISLDWRLAIAYNASLGCATVALRASGFRMASGAGQHYRTIQSLRYTINPDSELIITLEAICKKRAIVNYDSAGTVTETEVNEAILLAKELREMLTVWLKANYPAFLKIK